MITINPLLKAIRQTLLVTLLALATMAKSFAGPGAVDTTFNVSTDKTVYSVITQPDGKILIGGAFTNIRGLSHPAIARLFPDGTIDPAFTNSISSGGTVDAILMQPDGKILVAGQFNTFSQSINNIARLNVNGTLDGTFSNSLASGPILALALQADGKILIGGQFTTVSHSNHYYIARLNNDGTLDNSFNAGTIVGNAVNSIAVQDDGKILIGGIFNTFTSSLYSLNRQNIARLATNGTPDISYAPTATGPVQSMLLDEDDQSLVLGGAFTALDNFGSIHVGRLNEDGTIGTWAKASGVNNTVFAVAEDGDGNIYAGGIFNEFGNTLRLGVARFFADGTFDTTFNNSTNFPQPQVRCLAVQNDGKIIVGGTFGSFNSVIRTNIVRLYGDNYPAEITTQPLSRNIATGSGATFSVELSNPTPLTYQWRKNGVNIPGATFSEYSVWNAQMADAGNYSVAVSSGFGSTTSSNALLQVGDPPVITQQPTNLTIISGQDATFTAAATGTALSYFWYHNTTLVGTNAILTLSHPSLAGSYDLVVTNFVGSISTDPVDLNILYPVTFEISPLDTSVIAGRPVNFIATAIGTTPLHYQWFKNSNSITGATNNNYTIASATLTDAGVYTVTASNSFSSAASSVTHLSVGLAPQTLAPHLNSDGSLTIQMPGSAGFKYVMQTATNLLPPVTWQTVATNTTDTNGNWTFTDTNTAAITSQFYRVTAP